MADTDIFAELFEKLLSAPESGSGNGSDNGSDNGGGALDGILDGISPEMMITIVEIIGKLGERDCNTEFLAALKPLLREENRPNVDRAMTVMRLMSIIPLLRDSGIAGNLFK